MTSEEFAVLDGKGGKIKYAHEVTFSQLKEDTPDYYGRLIRKNDPPGQRWLCWQKSVQGASREGDGSKVPQEVMDYFQATKHLVKPPTQGKEMIPTTPRFTWSPSKIADFDNCPAQYAAKHYYKTIPYTETEATIWGTRVHAEAERFMRGEESTDPDAFTPVEKWVRVLSRLPGERFVEHKMSVGEDWKQVEWDDAEGRMIVDLAILNDEELLIYDWKTGKLKSDETQMKIYSLIMAMQFPQVQKIKYKYIWLKDGKTTGGELSRPELIKIALYLKAKLKEMKTAWENENFAMKKNGLCKGWCENYSCPHNGRIGK